MFDKTLFNNHLNEAKEMGTDYQRFDFLWKAFNVYYESLNQLGENVEEWRLIDRAIAQIPVSDYKLILDTAYASGIANISDIFNERDWNRFGSKKGSQHRKFKQVIQSLQRGVIPSFDHIQSLSRLLYLIRCNMAHGFKTIKGPRDKEVLGKALPCLEVLVKALPIP